MSNLLKPFLFFTAFLNLQETFAESFWTDVEQGAEVAGAGIAGAAVGAFGGPVGMAAGFAAGAGLAERAVNNENNNNANNGNFQNGYGQNNNDQFGGILNPGTLLIFNLINGNVIIPPFTRGQTKPGNATAHGFHGDFLNYIGNYHQQNGQLFQFPGGAVEILSIMKLSNSNNSQNPNFKHNRGNNRSGALGIGFSPALYDLRLRGGQPVNAAFGMPGDVLAVAVNPPAGANPSSPPPGQNNGSANTQIYTFMVGPQGQMQGPPPPISLPFVASAVSIKSVSIPANKNNPQGGSQAIIAALQGNTVSFFRAPPNLIAGAPMLLASLDLGSGAINYNSNGNMGAGIGGVQQQGQQAQQQGQQGPQAQQQWQQGPQAQQQWQQGPQAQQQWQQGPQQPFQSFNAPGTGGSLSFDPLTESLLVRMPDGSARLINLKGELGNVLFKGSNPPKGRTTSSINLQRSVIEIARNAKHVELLNPQKATSIQYLCILVHDVNGLISAYTYNKTPQQNNNMNGGKKSIFQKIAEAQGEPNKFTCTEVGDGKYMTLSTNFQSNETKGFLLAVK